MHAFPKGVMCKPESAEFDATIERTNQTKSIAVCHHADRCTSTAGTQVSLRSDHQPSAVTCDEISGYSYRFSQNDFTGFDDNFHNSNNYTHLSPNHALTSRTSSLANASNEQAGSSFKMSHSPVHSPPTLDWAAKSRMKRHIEPARPNRTSRLGQPIGLGERCEPGAIRTRSPPAVSQPFTSSHSHPFSFYLLNSSCSCNSHPAVDGSASPSTRSSTKLSQATKSPHPARLSACSPKATKPNSATTSPKVKASYAASSIASSFIILFCLILQLLANGVQAASTAFDYQNNQADNSIVYQGTQLSSRSRSGNQQNSN